MKRVDIRYDGTDYSIGKRHIDDVQNEIDAGLASSGPAWLIVNHGEGRAKTARLLITEGVAISLIGIEEPDVAELIPPTPPPPPTPPERT
jgi:hypothetical protein